MKYIAFIYKYEDDTSFTAVVPDLPGCVTCSDTFDDACSMIQEAAELWLEGESFPEAHELTYYTKEKREELDIPLEALTFTVLI